MFCRAEGEAGLYSHQPASHLRGQSSSSGEAAPGQRRGDSSLTAMPVRFRIAAALPWTAVCLCSLSNGQSSEGMETICKRVLCAGGHQPGRCSSRPQPGRIHSPDLCRGPQVRLSFAGIRLLLQDLSRTMVIVSASKNKESNTS